MLTALLLGGVGCDAPSRRCWSFEGLLGAGLEVASATLGTGGSRFALVYGRGAQFARRRGLRWFAGCQGPGTLTRYQEALRRYK
jgi:hypothetical protein